MPTNSRLKWLKPAEVPIGATRSIRRRRGGQLIVEAIRTEGESRRCGVSASSSARSRAPLVLRRDVELLAAWQATSHEDQATLKDGGADPRLRARSATVTECTPIPRRGGPCGRAGRGGGATRRQVVPLPSTVLMTAITARVAGCKVVRVASPKLPPIILAAASSPSGRAFVGGAHAIAALAYGAGAVGACDAVCGPGNMYVTAARRSPAASRSTCSRGGECG